jgi:putative hemolysin
MTVVLHIVAILVLIVLLSGSATSSGAETALFSLSQPQVRAFATDPDPRRRAVAALLARPRDLLVTILMINIAINILVQDVVAIAASDVSSWWVTVALPLALTVVFGELVPKSLALANNQRIALALAPFVTRVANWVRPVRTPVVRWATRISQLLFPFLKPSPPLTADEIRHALAAGSRSGALTPEEVELCQGALELNETPVRALMTPGPDMQTYDLHQPVQELYQLMAQGGRSRVPMTDGTIDHVVGILEAPIIFAHRPLIREAKDLIPLASKPLFVPEAMVASDALTLLLARGAHLALVVDEYGSVNGLITREDLAETVIGTAQEPSQDDLQRAGFDAYIASGKSELSAVEEALGLELPNSHHRVTIGGWLTDELARIPAAGDEYRGHGLYAQILAAEATRIVKLYLKKTGEASR